MTFWFMTASLTALLTVWVITPLMRERATVAGGWVVAAALPACALALYGILGTPGLAAY